MSTSYGSITSGFSLTQAGAITTLLDPLTVFMSLDILKTTFDEDENLTSYPIEKNGGVIGLLPRDTVNEKSKSVWEKMKHKELDVYINHAPVIADARDNVEVIFNRIISLNHPFDDIIIYYQGRYFGVLFIKDLLKQISTLRSNELLKARTLQQFFVQRNRVTAPDFEYDVFLDMAHDLGGDFYQNIQIDKHSYLLSLFDVCGKNITAALTTSFLAAFFATSQQNDFFKTISERQLVENLNTLLFEITPNDHFVAGVFFFINTANSELTIFNMGFSPVYLFSPKGGTVRLKILPPEFPPLGIGTTIEGEPTKVKIEPGMKVISYSDGLTDVKDPFGVTFGEKRLKTLFTDNFRKTIPQFTEILRKTIADFKKNAPQADDMSVLHIKFR
ncbi:MAG: SpoIIE family protein phosphatase [Spirochaetes bacterium]|jgi:hypothetical protein|nr:SpoIIE family protein phosphatase [Spirochaetota bacterium]